MPRSLRGRLVAILLIVAAVGLTLLSLITYVEQRRFLFERLDRQARDALPAINAALSNGTPSSSGDDRLSAGAFGSGFNLPPGTYGEIRGADGAVRDSVVISYSNTKHPAPKLPARMPARRTITVPATTTEDVTFRAVSMRNPDGSSLVVAVPLTDAEEALSRLQLVEAVVVIAVLSVLGLIAWLIVGFGLRPLDRIGRTADAIAGGDLSRRVEPEDKRTEIGRLGIALNRMLGALESSFSERHAIESRLRRFLADASHELRTPLTSIRGYAELYRTGAAKDPAAVERSMERIEQEAARMGTLVEDMLSLARLDELRDSEREAVDLTAIARDAVDDARASAPNREIALSAEPSTMALGDPDQLHQVLANLTANALSHTPGGTSIELSVTEEPDSGFLRLELRDHGPGLPTDDGAQLFERFSRGAKGRERSTGGAGLGLAIVDEIVRAHGGRVSAANAEGGGALFSVWLPAA